MLVIRSSCNSMTNKGKEFVVIMIQYIYDSKKIDPTRHITTYKLHTSFDFFFYHRATTYISV